MTRPSPSKVVSSRAVRIVAGDREVALRRAAVCAAGGDDASGAVDRDRERAFEEYRAEVGEHDPAGAERGIERSVAVVTDHREVLVGRADRRTTNRRRRTILPSGLQRHRTRWSPEPPLRSVKTNPPVPNVVSSDPSVL